MRAALIVCVLLYPMLAGWDWLESDEPSVKKGIEKFREGKFSAALEEFRKGEAAAKDPAAIQFNIGTSLYKMAEAMPAGEAREQLLLQSEEAFRRGTDTLDRNLRSSALYNMGNALFQRGKHQEALAAYRKALRTNPDNEDARHNYELALRYLEAQEQQKQDSGDQQNQDQPPPDPNQPQDPNGPKDQQGQNQDQQDQPESPDAGPPPAGADAGPPDAGQGAGQQNQEGNESEGQEQEPNDAQAGDPGDTRELPTDHESKMDALERRSRELRKVKIQKEGNMRGNQRKRGKKDW